MTERSEQIGGWRGLPFYTRVTISGLLVVALIITSLGILQMVSGGVDIDTIQGIVFYALFMIPTIGVVVLAWRRPDLTIVDGIWAMLVLLILAPSIPNALSTFNSFFDTGLLIPVVVSLIVVGVVGILAFLQHRRGTTRDVATIGERLVLLGTAAVVVGLMILSGTLHLTSLESVSVNEREGAVLVEIENSTFKPAQLAVSAGNPAKFIVKNRDLTVHTFTIKELGIDVKVLPGSEELIELSSPPAGTYVYLCTSGTGASLPLHKPEVESDPGVPSDTGTLVVS